MHALLGENGAGKSTLIKIISGVYKPDAGNLSVCAEEVSFRAPMDAQASGIATIYQELLLFPALTVAENIFLGHPPLNRFGGVDWPGMRQKAAQFLKSLEIHDLEPPSVVGALSIGNRQRVEIAKALKRVLRRPWSRRTMTAVSRPAHQIAPVKISPLWMCRN
ncbi:MAG: ATP-binding cassette domain-containing protein [Geminicoccaceae bacterium]